MICQQCHKNVATQVVSVLQNGKSIELSVCNECAKRLFPLPEGLSSLTDILFNIAKGTPPSPMAFKKLLSNDVPIPLPKSLVPPCRTCGLTRETLVEQRRFGCPDCYTTFSEDVVMFLQELQYGEKHVGRVPHFAKHRHQIAELKHELANAINANDFEKAAQLRDQIRGMQN